jgi:hypothetical protein
VAQLVDEQALQGKPLPKKSSDQKSAAGWWIWPIGAITKSLRCKGHQRRRRISMRRQSIASP